MLFDSLLIFIGILSIVFSAIFLSLAIQSEDNRLISSIVFTCVTVGVLTLFYMFIKVTPYYSIGVIDSSSKFPDLLQQVTSRGDLERIDLRENNRQMFSNICKNDKSCSKFEFPSVSKTCDDIKEINILPLYAKQLSGSYKEQYKYRIQDELYLTSYFNKEHKNDEDSEQYSFIRVKSNNDTYLYYFSSFSIGQTNGMNVIFNNKGTTIVEGKKPEIMDLSQTEFSNLINKTVAESCLLYDKKIDLKNEWINSEIKK